MSNDKNTLVDGLFVKKPSEKAPKWAVANISVNVDKLSDWLKANQNDKGYVNINLLDSKEGKLYAKLNEWKPKEKSKAV